MNKLPKVFQVPINKEFKNNDIIFHQTKNEDRSELIDKKEIYKIFSSSDHVYKTKLEITLKNKVVVKDVVGIKDNKLLTIDNDIINIDDIVKLKKV